MRYLKTIQAQYAASKKLNGILSTFEGVINLDKFTDDFLTQVWDISTASTYGLDVWGKIVGITRYLGVEDDPDFLGFDEAMVANEKGYPQPFNISPFYNELTPTSVVKLSDDIYRKLILSKAFSNITDATIPAINKFLLMLFKNRGRVYCTDNHDMTMNIVFEFYPTSAEQAIIKKLDIMPIPSGVDVRFVIAPTPNFGFSKDTYPADDGAFY